MSQMCKILLEYLLLLKVQANFCDKLKIKIKVLVLTKIIKWIQSNSIEQNIWWLQSCNQNFGEVTAFNPILLFVFLADSCQAFNFQWLQNFLISSDA